MTGVEWFQYSYLHGFSSIFALLFKTTLIRLDHCLQKTNKYNQDCLMAIITIQPVVLVNASWQDRTVPCLSWGEFGQSSVLGGAISHMGMAVENSTDVMYSNL